MHHRVEKEWRTFWDFAGVLGGIFQTLAPETSQKLPWCRNLGARTAQWVNFIRSLFQNSRNFSEVAPRSPPCCALDGSQLCFRTFGVIRGSGNSWDTFGVGFIRRWYPSPPDLRGCLGGLQRSMQRWSPLEAVEVWHPEVARWLSRALGLGPNISKDLVLLSRSASCRKTSSLKKFRLISFPKSGGIKECIFGWKQRVSASWSYFLVQFLGGMVVCKPRGLTSIWPAIWRDGVWEYLRRTPKSPLKWLQMRAPQWRLHSLEPPNLSVSRSFIMFGTALGGLRVIDWREEGYSARQVYMEVLCV